MKTSPVLQNRIRQFFAKPTGRALDPIEVAVELGQGTIKDPQQMMAFAQQVGEALREMAEVGVLAVEREKQTSGQITYVPGPKMTGKIA
jgi:hypothetical protein